MNQFVNRYYFTTNDDTGELMLILGQDRPTIIRNEDGSLGISSEEIEVGHYVMTKKFAVDFANEILCAYGSEFQPQSIKLTLNPMRRSTDEIEKSQ